jgi:hypothetical protein
MTSNNGYSSASGLKSSLNGGSHPTAPFFTDCRTELTWLPPNVFLITSLQGPRRQHRSFSYANRFRRNVYTEPFPSNGRLFLLIMNQLPSNGRRSVVCFEAVA